MHDCAGERIGPYQLVELLGEGGMGEVYLAEQRAPVRRQAAIKRIKVGMDTRGVMARFEAERQALALMDHPNIARIYDAGAGEDGRPYFAMEYVPGVPLTEYCDRHGLGTRERLGLFAQVCEGVQHAHQKGVLHRDLKPSNVLVAREGDRAVPKIIDFGIAKAVDRRLTESTYCTLTGEVMGTPAYMSPEQAGSMGQDIDTRADIYSLGVVLYELLAGVPPFDAERFRRAGFLEMQRIIREEVPAKPSTRVAADGGAPKAAGGTRGVPKGALRRELRGDLDWIVLKALEKDRTRRYASASEFGGDLRRYLAHEPVTAGPPSLGYRIRKYCRRYRGQVAAAGAVFAALAVGLGMSLASLHATRRQAAEILRLSDVKVLRDLRAEAESLLGTSAGRREVLKDWLGRARGLVERGAAHAEMLGRLKAQAPAAGAPAEVLWQGDVLQELEAGIHALQGTSPGEISIARVEGWLAVMPSEEDLAARWDAALRSIGDLRECPAYAGLAMERQANLIPLRRDPGTKLWEFVHAGTGVPPVIGEDGRLVLSEDTGVVLVLLPGGTFSMGADAYEEWLSAAAVFNRLFEDPEGYLRVSTVPPPLWLETVRIAPFFLAKYELTKSVWKRFFSADIESHRGSPLLPMGNLSWEVCEEFCGKFGFVLPTEAQWEYACRAGTSSPFHGPMDASAWHARNSRGTPHPVGQLAANGFGLHDMLGNLWEWCYEEPPGAQAPPRVMCGGDYEADLTRVRFSPRRAELSSRHFAQLGMRPARPLALTQDATRFDPATLDLFTSGKPYLGAYETGLYPGGTHAMPEAHRRAGERLAATIRPLDAEGRPDDGGWIVALVFGHSNARQYFVPFQEHLRANSDRLHPRFELLNAATAGQHLFELLKFESVVWERADRLLRQPGYRRLARVCHEPLTRLQVQVLFLHTTLHEAGSPRGHGPPPARFPESMQRMQREVAEVLAHCASIYPNLKIAYLTCDGLRHFTGMEPHVWREAFALKWLIESQIRGEPGTDFEAKDGRRRRLPWLTWGPYIWDNTWDRSYFADGVHPAPKAQEIVVKKLWEHLSADSAAQPWMYRQE